MSSINLLHFDCRVIHISPLAACCNLKCLKEHFHSRGHLFIPDWHCKRRVVTLWNRFSGTVNYKSHICPLKFFSSYTEKGVLLKISLLLYVFICIHVPLLPRTKMPVTPYFCVQMDWHELVSCVKLKWYLTAVWLCSSPIHCSIVTVQ